MNILVICSDTFRWDYIGAYGNDWIQTPHLDKLASESVIFDDAFAEGLPTLPARRVLMTGRPIVPFEFRPQNRTFPADPKEFSQGVWVMMPADFSAGVDAQPNAIGRVFSIPKELLGQGMFHVYQERPKNGRAPDNSS